MNKHYTATLNVRILVHNFKARCYTLLRDLRYCNHFAALKLSSVKVKKVMIHANSGQEKLILILK